MPAVRKGHHDIVIRVPKAVNVPKTAREEEGTNDESSASQQQKQVGGSGELLNSASHITEGSALTPSRRSASPVKGSRSDDQHSSLLAEGTVNGKPNGQPQQQEKVPPSRYHFANQAISAAEWNSLLIWARRQRGPQWDSSTGMWQVDQGSTEYYAFSNDPARHTKLSTATLHHDSNRAEQDQKNEDREGGGLGGNHEDEKHQQSIPNDSMVSHSNANSSGTLDLNGRGNHGSGAHLPPFHQSSSSISVSGLFQGGPTNMVGANDDSSPPPMGPGGRRARGR